MELLALDSRSLDILWSIGISMFLGAMLGIERELSGKPAGLRTHMLVAGASALLLGVGHLVVDRGIEMHGSRIATDPLRMIGSVVTGISFLGAGTIVHHLGRDKVEGLTTASSLLFTAAIAMSVAMGAVGLAILVTLLALAVIWGLRRLERALDRFRQEKPLTTRR